MTGTGIDDRFRLFSLFGFSPFDFNIMFKKLYLLFGIGVIGLYSMGSWLGWELANSGRNSRLGVPFFMGGYRGGK